MWVKLVGNFGDDWFFRGTTDPQTDLALLLVSAVGKAFLPIVCTPRRTLFIDFDTSQIFHGLSPDDAPFGKIQGSTYTLSVRVLKVICCLFRVFFPCVISKSVRKYHSEISQEEKRHEHGRSLFSRVKYAHYSASHGRMKYVGHLFHSWVRHWLSKIFPRVLTQTTLWTCDLLIRQGGEREHFPSCQIIADWPAPWR